MRSSFFFFFGGGEGQGPFSVWNTRVLLGYVLREGFEAELDFSGSLHLTQQTTRENGKPGRHTDEGKTRSWVSGTCKERLTGMLLL